MSQKTEAGKNPEKEPFINRLGSLPWQVLFPLIILAALYAILSLASLVRVVSGPLPFETSQGFFLFWCDRLYGWWLTLTFILINIGLGFLVLCSSCLRNSFAKDIIGLLSSFTVGTFTFYAVLMCLVVSDTLNSMVGNVLVMLTVSAGVYGFAKLARTALKEPALVPEIQNFANKVKKSINGPVLKSSPYLSKLSPGLKFFLQLSLLLFCVTVWVWPYLLQTALPDTAWDSSAYHLPLAKSLFEGGFWNSDPLLTHASFPGAIHLFYGLFLQLHGGAAIIPFNYLVSWAAILAVFSFGEKIWSRTAGMWGAAICITTNLVWEVSLDARIDNFLAFYSALACFSFFLWAKHTERIGLLVVSAMALGMAIGTKYTAVFLIPPLGVLLLVTGYRVTKQHMSGIIALFSIVLFLTILPSGIWYLRNAIELQDPIYPLLSGTKYRDKNSQIQHFDAAFESFAKLPLTQQSLAARDARKTEIGQKEETVVPVQYQNRSLLKFWDVLLSPNLHARTPYNWLNPLLLLSVLLPLLNRGKLALGLYFLTMAALIPIAQKTFLIRYLLPVLPLMAMGAGLFIEKINRGKIVQIVTWSVIVIIALFISHAEYEKLRNNDPGKLFSGEISEEQWFLKEGYSYSSTSGIRFLAAVNNAARSGKIDPDAAIFLFGESKGYRLLNRHIPDMSREGIPWLAELINAQGDLDRVTASFRKQGIKYVYVDMGYVNYHRLRGELNSRQLDVSIAYMDEFLKKFGRMIYRDENNHTYMFELSPQTITSED